MRKIYILLMFLLGLQHVSATDRTDSEIYRIAYQQLFGDNQRRTAGEAQLRELSKTDRYVIMGTDDAFVIVSKNDSFTPVLALSHTPYQADGMPDGFYWWLEAISKRMATNSSRRAVSFTPIDNFVKTQWGQNDPYNGMCPKVGVSRPPTGCVATAMAQIMKYYQHPSKGEGEGSYIAGTKGKTVDVNHEYYWDRMLNSYGSGSKPNALQKVAVQYLMADAGAAAHMEYSVTGSSSSCYDAALGFISNFKYDSLAIRNDVRSMFSDDEWMEMIYRNLSQSQPILYGASDKKSGGHAFVFSGIDSEGKVYVNWGWDGSADGYYDIADLSPVIDGKETGDHFNENQTMVCGIKPLTGPISLPSKDYQSLWACTEKYFVKTVDKNLVELALESLWNYQLITFTGVLDIFFENTSGGADDYLLFYDTAEGGAVPSGYGFSFGGEYARDTIDVTPLAPGTYKVYFRSKDERELEPQMVRVYDIGAYYITLKKSEDGTIVTSSDSDDPTAIHNLRSDVPMSAPVRYYDLQGREVNSRTRGLLIRRQGNEAKKVMVK